MNSKINFVSFADKRYKPSLDRLRDELSKFKNIDSIYLFDDSSFDKEYRKIYKDRFSDKGFGFWMWKSYFVKKVLLNLNDGDYLIYCDAGCKLNFQGEQRLMEYLDIVIENETGILLFKQDGDNEKCWTKGDLFEYFSVTQDREITDTPQMFAGIIIIRKNELSKRFVNEWFNICHNHYDLLNDKPSKVVNFAEFIQHRYDQSVISVLSKIYKCAILPLTEVRSINGDWSDYTNIPILVTRSKQMGKKDSLKYKLLTPVRVLKRYFRGYGLLNYTRAK